MLPAFTSARRLLLHFSKVRAKFACSLARRKEYHFPVKDYTGPNHLQEDFCSLEFSGIAKNVVSKGLSDRGEFFSSFALKDYLLKLSEICPEIVRRYWRIIDLKPRDVLEILLVFESDSGKYEIESKKVVCLWGIFNWTCKQCREYEHFPLSCKIMASLLVRVRLFKEAESVLSRSESKGILLDCQEIFSSLIEGSLTEFEFERAICAYDRMRGLSLIPKQSTYLHLLKYLVGVNETQLMQIVYIDMIGTGIETTIKEHGIHETVISLLCIDGKVLEARNLVKKLMAFGVQPSYSLIRAISIGYCEKKDYDGILMFFAEISYVPDVRVGNGILFSSCKNFGVEQGSLVLQKMEEMGFHPDEKTLGILIGFSCHERKMKKAFVHLSDIQSRSLKPHVNSYNALLSGIFVEGLWLHSQNILDEMNEIEVAPNLSTFRVLLAGFVKARQFDEAKAVIQKMTDLGIIKLSSSEDPQTKAFMLLGIDPMNVKIRRDNHACLPKTEFFDNMGNGLYLDLDLDEFERSISKTLSEAVIPNFNSYLLENFHGQDKENSFALVNEMESWGEELSLCNLSSLIRGLSRSSFSINTVNCLLSSAFKSIYHIDPQSLNWTVLMYSKKGLTFSAMTLFSGMMRRSITIENCTYSALLIALCKKNDLNSFRYCYKVARKCNWSPNLENSRTLFSYLCQKKWLNETLMLFETMLIVNPHNVYSTFLTVLEELCCNGFTRAALVLMEEFPCDDISKDHMAYSYLIRGFCKEEKLNEAITILDFMLSRNMTPVIDVSLQLIYQLSRSKNIEKAIALKDICIREQPDIILAIQSFLINGYCKLKMMKEATALFKETLKCRVLNVEAINLLIQGYCKEKKSKKVKELLGIMIKNSLNVSISSYSHLIRLLCSESMFSQTLCLKKLLREENNHPDSVLYNILLFQLFSAQNTTSVDGLIDELQQKGLQHDEATYNYLIQGFIWCTDPSRSLSFIAAMISHGLQPSNRSLREVMCYLCWNNELEDALNMSRELERRGWKHGSVIQNTIVRALLNHGRSHEAIDFLNRMEGKGLIPDKIEYDFIIKLLYRHGRLDKAVDLLNIMLGKGRLPESASYDFIIKGYCDVHKLDLALDFHSEMLYRDLKPSMRTWEILICRLCEDDRVAEAEKLLNSMIHLGETPSREMFCSVINKYQSLSNMPKSSDILNLMQQKGYIPDFDTQWSVISNLSSSSGKPSQSLLSNLLSGFGFARPNQY